MCFNFSLMGNLELWGNAAASADLPDLLKAAGASEDPSSFV